MESAGFFCADFLTKIVQHGFKQSYTHSESEKNNSIILNI